MSDEEKPGLAGYLKRQRLRYGWTQVQLAERSGVPQPTISDIERGTNKLTSADNRRKLAHALRVRPVDLLVAAGELLPEEAPQGGVAESPAPYDATDPNDPRARIYRVVEALPDPDDIDGLAGLAEWWEKQILKRSRVIAAPADDDALTSFYRISPNWTDRT